MRLLITGAWQCQPQMVSEIEKMGYDVCLMKCENDPLPCTYEWADGVVCNRLFDFHSIEKFVNLSYIQLTSAGTDQVSAEYIETHKIKLKRAVGVYGIPMSEFAIGAVLEVYQQRRILAEQQKKHEWKKIRGWTELYGKTVGIIGYGNVGRECAKRFEAFGCHIIKVRSDGDHYDEAIKADIVIVTAALTSKTRALVNPSEMKKDGLLVNLSRGAVVNEKVLKKTEHIKGAVLDVFETEPLQQDSPLWDRDGFVITPHCSFSGDGVERRLDLCIMENLSNYITEILTV